MDTIILWFIAGFIIAFWLGKHYAQIKFLHKISEDPDKMIDLLQQIKKINEDDEVTPIVSDAIEVMVEQENGSVYAYNKASGEFLAQAANLHQAMILAAQRHPTKKFWHPELKQDTQST